MPSKLSIATQVFDYLLGFTDRETRRSRARLVQAGTIASLLIWIRSVQKADEAQQHLTESRTRRAELVRRRQQARQERLARRSKLP